MTEIKKNYNIFLKPALEALYTPRIDEHRKMGIKATCLCTIELTVLKRFFCGFCLESPYVSCRYKFMEYTSKNVAFFRKSQYSLTNFAEIRYAKIFCLFLYNAQLSLMSRQRAGVQILICPEDSDFAK